MTNQLRVSRLRHHARMASLHLVLIASIVACDSQSTEEEEPPGAVLGPVLTWREATLPESGGDPMAVTVGADGVLYAVNAIREGRYTPFDRTGYYTSSDAGTSWEHVSDVQTDKFRAPHEFFHIESTSPRSLLAFAAPRATRWQLILSTDGGESWTSPEGVELLSSDASITSRVGGGLFGVDRGWGTSSAFRAVDGGSTWTSHPLPSTVHQRVAYFGAGPTTVYMADEHFHRSVDGGRTWERTTLAIPREMAVNASGQTAMLTRWGLTISGDDGLTWSQQPSPGVVVSVTPSIQPGEFVALVATEGEYSVFLVSDLGTTWRQTETAGIGLGLIRERGLGQPMIRQLPDGRLIVTVRSRSNDGASLLLVSDESA